MRIFILGSSLNSLLRFRERLLNEIIEKGHEVFVVAANDVPKDVIQQVTSRNINIIDVKIKKARISLLADLLFFYKIHNVFKNFKPDVVLLSNIKPVIYGNLSGLFFSRIRIISLITGLGYAFIPKPGLRYFFISYLVRILYKILIAKSSHVIFQNKDDRDIFLSMKILTDRSNVAVVPGSGVPLDQFPEHKIVNFNRFLMVGRLLEDKGVREYVEAARKIRNDNPRASFTLMGGLDDNYASIKSDELSEWIKEGVINYVPYSDKVLQQLVSCTWFVLPSYREGCPRSVLEAMSVGRPIITTNAPGCRDTVEEGYNGFLCTPRSAAALSDIIQKAINLSHADTVKMGQASRRRAEDIFDVAKVNRQVVNLVLNNGN